MDEVNFLAREARKCREAALRSADLSARAGMDQLAGLYERQAALLRRRSVHSL